uniref:Uncharacterized protein n=1 Tax=Tanacetum cinerariifolium TaxID=118510 RepID=A0A699T7Q5_TANCI|nr:hypothetical protein [Tanacetum cinerariifolium]
MNFETISSQVVIERGGSFLSHRRDASVREKGNKISLITEVGTSLYLIVEVILLNQRMLSCGLSFSSPKNCSKVIILMRCSTRIGGTTIASAHHSVSARSISAIVRLSVIVATGDSWMKSDWKFDHGRVLKKI